MIYAHDGAVDIFAPRDKKKTAAYHLGVETVKGIERIAKKLGQSKSSVADQLLRWGLERYEKEAGKRK